MGTKETKGRTLSVVVRGFSRSPWSLGLSVTWSLNLLGHLSHLGLRITLYHIYNITPTPCDFVIL